MFSLAKENNIKDIHKMRLKYGDYLYTKGDFENAAKQYIETINYIEPSYVIKKVGSKGKVKYVCFSFA